MHAHLGARQQPHAQRDGGGHKEDARVHAEVPCQADLEPVPQHPLPASLVAVKRGDAHDVGEGKADARQLHGQRDGPYL